MSIIKYFVSILAIATLVVGLAACGRGGSSTVPSSNDGTSLSSVKPTSLAEPTAEIPSGTHLACFIFEEVEYTFDDVRTVTPDQPTAFIVEGIQVDVTNLELVGGTTKAKTRCMDQVSEVYRSNEVADAEAIYTFTSESNRVNPEDGQIFEIPAEWIRWTAADR